MGLFPKPRVPTINMPPPAAHPPTMSTSEVQLAGIQARQRARAAEGKGLNDTIKTSPQGVSQPSSGAPSTLLGG